MSQTQYTILIVEDSPEDRELYRRFLLRDAACSYTILEAATGREGLALWHQHHPDLLLLDYRLPDLDGLTFLAQLQDPAQLPCLPVVMLTGLGNEAIAVKAIKAGVQDYLVKGQITPEGLHLAIHGAIATVRLHTQLQQRIERERVISQITRQIHSSLDLEEILQTAVCEVRKFLQTDRVVVFRLQSDGWGTVVTESVGAEWASLLSTSLHDPCFNQNYSDPFRQGRVTVKPDIYDGSIDPCHVELLANLQVRANLVVPILQDHQLWGMLIAHHCASPRQWETLEIDLLKELATQLGIALQQAELYQQAQNELAERKQAEARLRESQHFIQQIAETTPGILYIYDLIEQRNFYVNQQVTQLLGYTAEQVQAMGTTFLPTLMHPEDFAQVPAHITRFHSAQDYEVLELEYRMQHANGTWRWFHGREVIFSRTADGLPQQILGICQDITDRKQTEVALLSAMVRFEQAATAVNCLIYEWDLQQGTVERTRGLMELLGYTPEEADSTVNWWSDRIHPDDFARFALDEFWQRVATEDRFYTEYRVQHKQGHYLWVEDHQIVVRNAQGQPLKLVGSTTDITNRKQAEQALLESETRFRQLAENINVVFWVAEFPERRVSYVSPAYKRLWGLNPQDVYENYKNWVNLVHPDDRAEIDRAFQEKVTQGRFDEEYRIVLPDGRMRWVRDRCFPLRDELGRVYRLTGIAEDITERKATEAALKESEERFRQMAENISDIFWMMDLEQKQVLYISPAFDQVWGRSREPIYQEWGAEYAYIHPEDQERVRAIAAQVIQTNGFDMEYRIVRPDGTIRYLRDRGFVVPNEQGQLTRLLGVAQDITDRKQAELERERRLTQEQQYTNQLRGLAQAALSINSAITIDHVLNVITEQAAHTIGCHQAVTTMNVSQNWADAITTIYLSDKYAQWRGYNEKPDGTGVYSLVCQLNRSLRMTQAELEAHPRWRSFGKASANHPPIRGWLAVPLIGRDGQNTGLIQLSDKYAGEFTEEDEAILVQLAQVASVAIENIRLYEAEQHARADAERANRIKDEFLAVLSHELRSPLNPILGWTQLMQSRNFNPDRTAEALATIERNAKLQVQLIDDLLDTARILRGKLSLNNAPVELVFVIEAAIDTVSTAVAAKSMLLHPVLPQIGQVYGDATRLQQVVWNLLSNAVKFTPAGGRIEVRLEQVGSRELGIGSREDDNHSPSYAQITISDTGKGIKPEFLPYLFESFRQEDASVSRNYGGLGLGLSIVRHLVEAHGGTVWAESKGEGQGATFSVRLPLLRTASVSVQSNEWSEQDLDLSGIRILAVDDELDARELLNVMLTQYGAEVLTVVTAAEVLSTLDFFQPNVLISDVGMPNVDGYTLIQQVRALPADKGGQIPAIALTAYAGEEDRQRALMAGFQDHISKPIDPGLLVKSVTNLTQKNEVSCDRD